MTDDLETSADLEEEEKHQDSGTREPEKSRTYRAFRWIATIGPIKFFFIIGFATVLVGLAAAALGLIPNKIPREAHIALILFLVAGWPADNVAAKPAKAWLWDPMPVFLVDVSLEKTDGALWSFSSQGFREVEVDGELHFVTPFLCFGKNYSQEELTVDGVWLGSLSDRELMIAQKNISELRNQLKQDAQLGFAYRSHYLSIIRVATQRTVMSVIETFEHGALPDRGAALHDEIDNALDQFDIDDHVKNAEDKSPVESKDVATEERRPDNDRGEDPLAPTGGSA